MENKRLEDGLLRESGLKPIGQAPWGTHFCQFYQTKEDLIDILVPYFKAGLKNNEFCMWITAEPLGVDEAKKALQKEVKDLGSYIKKGQIEIMDYRKWYTKSGRFNEQEVLTGWVAKEKNALKKGFAGLRLTGNTFWLEKKDWKAFTDYEETVNNVIGQHRMMAICTYSLAKCNALEIIDVIANHQFALINRSGRWEVIESSDYRQAKEALRESEARYRSLFANMMDAFTYSRMVLDKNGIPADFVLLEANDAFDNLTGLKKETLIGKRFTEIFPGIEKDPAGLIIILGKVALTGKNIKFEHYFRPLDKWYSISAYSPEKGYFVAVFDDITERKQAEEKIRVLSKFPAENPNPVMRIKSDGTLLYCNKAGAPLAKHWKWETGKSVSAEWRKLVTDAFKSGAQKNIEMPADNRLFLFILAPIVSEGYVNVYGRDITERKQAEEALHKSEEKYRRIVETAAEGIVIGAPDGTITFCNQRWADMLGHPINQIIGRAGLDFMEEEQKALILENRKQLKTGKNLNVEIKYRRKDGSELWTLCSASPILDNQGKHLANLAMHTDITERKQAEEALKEREKWLNKTQEMAHLGSWDLDLVNNRLSWSDEVYRIFGLKPQEFTATYEAFMERVHPDDRSAVDKAYSGSLREGKDTYEIEHRIIRKSTGEIRIVHEKCEHIRDDSGRIIRSIGMVQDITERRMAEEKIRDSEIKFRAIFDSAPCGIMIVDQDRRALMVNKTIERTFNISGPAVLNRRGGETIGCIHVFETTNGCGYAESCKVCQVRNTTLQALEGMDIHRSKAKVELLVNGEVQDRLLLVSAAPVEYEGKRAAIVILEDITELNRLRQRLKTEYSFAGIVTRDAKMHEVFDIVRKLAEVNVPVLIQGESGTGKELIASAIHNEGLRAAQPFVPVNCGALPDNLLESELFGYVKGAFTGAHRDKKGRFELADKGTIFLDEIGDLSPAMQVKLLRVLQTGSFERLGDEKTVKVDVRVISATNKSLEKEIAAGRFREDLFYRLCGMPITLPPLRERINDISLLTEYFLEQIAQESGRAKVSLSPEALDLLMDYKWPGNIRELQNTIQFALVKCHASVIEPRHLPLAIQKDVNNSIARGQRRRKLESKSITDALQQAKGNKRQCAKLLGVSRATLYRFLDEQKITK